MSEPEKHGRMTSVEQLQIDLARAPVKGHRGPVSCVNFSADRQTLASGGGDGTVLIWNARSGHIVQTLTPDSNRAMFDVVFSRRTLMSGTYGGSLALTCAQGELLRADFEMLNGNPETACADPRQPGRGAGDAWQLRRRDRRLLVLRLECAGWRRARAQQEARIVAPGAVCRITWASR
jgi:WD domain, G-beta repeat